MILAGIVSLAIGAIGGHPTAIGLGVALAGLGGMEVAIREHFAGYRSHTLVLAAFPAVASAVIIGLVGVPLYLIVPIMLGVFLAAFVALRRVWERTSHRSLA